MSGRPYLSSEDSRLLREALGPYSGERYLEIGAGNAGGLVKLSKRFSTVVGTDIVRPSMSDWREAGASVVLTDGASCLRDGSFDLVAFNPPYLPVVVGGDVAVEGGEELEVPKRFLSEALRVVAPGGRVVMLLNDSSPMGPFEEECAKRGFRLQVLAKRRVFFEELTVYEAMRPMASASG